ncbi:hypothetical protein Pint_25650 [Pistacia integerrima]|uniref:Uncharacterized protein n=1 Tax=Pistacia integerrima TaxID=434235 RepID=A0ACC0YDL7_9ROSI|nr:hypothetical protein Pint_25650 [Pistacia integerrima]
MDSDFNVPGFPERCRFHVTKLHHFFRMAHGTDPWSRFMQPQISMSLGSYGMLCNTVEEVGPQALEWLRKYTKIPVWTVGPLLPPAFLKKLSSSVQSSNHKQHSGKLHGISLEMCVEWLDLQPPTGFDFRGEFRAEWLPEGFEERVKKSKQGLLVRNWAPQLEILSHKSTGAFLSHCGWNSVMKSLSQGVPLIGWAMAGEQAFNSKMLVEEMGVSVELTRGLQNIVGKEVKEVIILAMSKTQKGEEMKQNAAKIRKQIRASVMEEGEAKGSSIKVLDDFVRSIVSRRQEQSVC